MENVATENLGLHEESFEEQNDSSQPIENVMTNPPEPKPETDQKEPGWFQSRWNKEVGKLTDKIRSEMRDEYEKQFAPIRDRLIESEAQELVRTGAVKDLETAKELVRYRQGQPSAAPAAKEPPRNEKGQFTKDDPVIQAKALVLGDQAKRVEAKTGIDVMAVFNKDAGIRNKILSGEMDFYELADQLSEEASHRPPSPARSPNGVTGVKGNAIMNMSKEEFARLNEKLDQGARFSY